MRRIAILVLLAPLVAGAQEAIARLGDEIAAINRIAEDPDTKLPMLHAMATQLGTHRNRLLLLKKQSGESFAQIFVNQLRTRGLDDRAIEKRLRGLRQSFPGEPDPETPSPAIRPVLFAGSTVDHNAAGTFVTLAPEAGLDAGRWALAAGIPIYRISSGQREAAGAGDAYLAGFLRGRAGPYDLGSSLVVSFPTGDRDRGLGAGQTAVDWSGTLERRWEPLRPFLSGGFTNSVFNNVGYQRPFISNGKAVYASGGTEVRLHRRLIVGGGGFALRGLGTHTVISRMPGAMAPSVPGGPLPGGGPMPPGTGPGMSHQPPASAGPAAPAPVRGEEVADHGASGWATLYLHPCLRLTLTAARSFPYELTTVRVGVGWDLWGTLSRARRR